MKFTRSCAPGFMVFFFLIFYQLFYAFNFAPITEGWFSVYAWLIRSGEVPYRDFSLLMPPVYPLLIASFQYFFGDGFFALRIVGIFVVGGIGVCLWFILTRLFNPWISGLSAIIAALYYQMGNAFIPYDFTQFLTFNLLFGSALILLSIQKLETKIEKHPLVLSSFFSGFFFGIAVLIKQSNAGFFVLALSIGYAIVLFRSIDSKQALRIYVQYIFGGLLPLIVILLWLGLNDAIKNFYLQIVFDALQSKGGSGTIIIGWIKGFFGDPSYLLRSIQISINMLGLFVWTAAPLLGVLVWANTPHDSLNKIFGIKKITFDGVKFPIINFYLVITSFLLLALFSAWYSSPQQNASSQNAHQFTIALLAELLKFCIWTFSPLAIILFLHKKLNFFSITSPLNIIKKWINISAIFVFCVGYISLIVVVVLTYFSPQYISPSWLAKGGHFGSSLIVFSTNAYFIGTAVMLSVFIHKPTLQKALIFILFVIGLGLTFGNGTSAGLSEISSFYGLSILLAVLFSVSAPFLLPSFLPLLISLYFSSFLIEAKMAQPYAWWTVKSENIRLISCAKSTGVLDGICVDPEKYKKIMEIAEQIKSVSNVNDRLYVFPHLPIFNLLSDRKPFENAVVSWFDFTSKAQAKNIALSLLQDPPRVLLIARLPSEVFETHERLFNHSETSEQRNIINAVDYLQTQGRIKMIDSSVIDGINIELYQRVN